MAIENPVSTRANDRAAKRLAAAYGRLDLVDALWAKVRNLQLEAIELEKEVARRKAAAEHFAAVRARHPLGRPTQEEIDSCRRYPSPVYGRRGELFEDRAKAFHEAQEAAKPRGVGIIPAEKVEVALEAARADMERAIKRASREKLGARGLGALIDAAVAEQAAGGDDPEYCPAKRAVCRVMRDTPLRSGAMLNAHSELYSWRWLYINRRLRVEIGNYQVKFFSAEEAENNFQANRRVAREYEHRLDEVASLLIATDSVDETPHVLGRWEYEWGQEGGFYATTEEGGQVLTVSARGAQRRAEKIRTEHDHEWLVCTAPWYEDLSDEGVEPFYGSPRERDLDRALYGARY